MPGPNNYRVNADTTATKAVKKAYNKAVRTARENAAIASALRAEIVADNPQYAGPSTDHLDAAVTSLASARTFATTE